MIEPRTIPRTSVSPSLVSTATDKTPAARCALFIGQFG